ncbi:MAG: dockerin type I repeat-containing protein, partial [Clostridia bacterium]|nr:dockerin type I repeat-containing protein [Clostridia bacterium]
LDPNECGLLTLDFGSYVREQGHVGDNGLVSIVSCQMFVVGGEYQVVQLFECGFTNESDAPTELSGAYTIENGYLDGVAVGVTAEALKSAMDHSDLLSVTDQNGNAVSGKVGTGMVLTLTVDGNVVDSATVVVRGDVNGDGDASTTDARLAILHQIGDITLDGASSMAADCNRDGNVDTFDVREMLFNLSLH